VRLAQICQLGKVDANLCREVGVIFGTALFASHFLGPVSRIELQSLNESNHIEQCLVDSSFIIDSIAKVDTGRPGLLLRKIVVKI
jgi:hypothetical protein